MYIGIMSDSHGNVKRTERAVTAIKKYDPVHVFHCGDICSQAVITELEAGFADPVVPVTCVLGNCDGWEDGLTTALPHVTISGRFANVNINGKKIAVIHGHETDRFEHACMSGDFDYVLTGHTHIRSDDQLDSTRVINPGALHRAMEPGCAVLNIDTNTLTFIDIP